VAHSLKRRPDRAIRRQQVLTRVRYAAVVLAAVGMVAAGILVKSSDHKPVVIGRVPLTTVTTQPTIAVPEPDIGRAPIAPPKNSSSLLAANGSAYGRALAFHSNIPVKDGLVFVLIVGSDARPGQDLHKTRTDSLHVVAIDPATRSGTIVGIPRDTYVNIPGKGMAKINTAMGSGGPSLLMQTVREFTNLPIEYYVLTGFQGFAAMVDDLGGVDVYVPRNMDDDYSDAHFAQGYHHFNGEQALAFCRDRHSVKYGDFTRSENQGLLMLATLAKMRAEVSDDEGLHRWLGVLANYAELDVPMGELDGLAALARRLAPEAINNVVMPGKTGSASGGQSVVYPTEAAAAMWGDLRDDARITGSAPVTSPDDTSDTTDTTFDETPTTEDTTTTTSGFDPFGNHSTTTEYGG
jgi:LCP family protein required for cell wall assembly